MFTNFTIPRTERTELTLQEMVWFETSQVHLHEIVLHKNVMSESGGMGTSSL